MRASRQRIRPSVQATTPRTTSNQQRAAADKTGMRLDMRPDSDLLRVDVTGDFSLDEAKRTFLEMMEAVAFHRTTRVLVDGRTVKGNPEPMERFYYGEFAAQTV